MKIGVDARCLGLLKTGVGTYVAEVLNHWPGGLLPDSFTLFSHQPISHPRTVVMQHCVSGSRWGLPWYLFRSHRMISSRHPSIFWATQALLPLQLPKAFPVVVTVHDCIHQLGLRYAPSLPYNWTHRCLLPWAVSRAAKILVVSRFVADEVLRHFGVPAAKIEVTPLGVRKEFFGLREDGDLRMGNLSLEPQPAVAWVLARHQITAPFILGVGTLEPRKNLKTLLEAFALLPSQWQSRFQLVLAGKPGWGKADLQRYLQRYPQRSHLRLTGYVPEADLRSLYAAAAMFVFPSFYEGFGLPVVEALAAGCPVIASSAASLREVAGSAAVFLDPHSPPQEWSRAIVRVAESAELRHSLSNAGPAQARSFSWEACAGRTAEVVRSVAKEEC
ncbi:MAG: glycosyltransferase family 4 protein [Acidobacteria bacterium]|nr:glycosyltransferase family 4 protein [Acidobacteriota bacterium]